MLFSLLQRSMMQRILLPGLTVPVFVSADRRLLAAAAAEGLATDDPDQHM